MTTLIARFTALPDHRDEVVRLIAAYAEHVRGTDGTIFFEPTTSRDRPDEVVVLEQYRDDAAFDAHLADPENAAFNSRLGPLVVGDGSVLEILDPVTGH